MSRRPRPSGPATVQDVLARDILNLGCGRKPRADAVNVDIRAAAAGDRMHDLNRRPWMFPAWFLYVELVAIEQE